MSPLEILTGINPRRPETFIDEALNGEERAPDLEETFLDNHSKRLAETYDKVRSKITGTQEKTKQRVKCKGKPFEMGQLVRRKLTSAERSKYGKKLSPYKSERYKIVKRLKDTYWITPCETSQRRQTVLRRHFDDLEPAPEINHLSWEESDHDTGSLKRRIIVPSRRYPSRSRTAAKYLQVKMQGKKHSEDIAKGVPQQAHGEGMQDSDTMTDEDEEYLSAE